MHKLWIYFNATLIKPHLRLCNFQLIVVFIMMHRNIIGFYEYWCLINCIKYFFSIMRSFLLSSDNDCLLACHIKSVESARNTFLLYLLLAWIISQLYSWKYPVFNLMFHATFINIIMLWIVYKFTWIFSTSRNPFPDRGKLKVGWKITYSWLGFRYAYI